MPRDSLLSPSDALLSGVRTGVRSPFGRLRSPFSRPAFSPPIPPEASEPPLRAGPTPRNAMPRRNANPYARSVRREGLGLPRHRYLQWAEIPSFSRGRFMPCGRLQAASRRISAWSFSASNAASNWSRRVA